MFSEKFELSDELKESARKLLAAAQEFKELQMHEVSKSPLSFVRYDGGEIVVFCDDSYNSNMLYELIKMYF